jgi:chorismate mutase
VAVRAIRGATQLDRDEREHLLQRVSELVAAVLERNQLQPDEIVSMVFTATRDLRSEFPAYAARSFGIGEVPLLCAQELDVRGALPRVVRLLAHVETGRTRSDIRHVYLHGARRLRTDLDPDGLAGDEAAER